MPDTLSDMLIYALSNRYNKAPPRPEQPDLQQITQTPQDTLNRIGQNFAARQYQRVVEDVKQKKKPSKSVTLPADPVDSIMPAQGPKGGFTDLLVRRPVQAISSLLGTSERTAAQNGEYAADLSYDWNPYSYPDVIGTQIHNLATSPYDFRGGDLATAGINTVLMAVPGAGKVILGKIAEKIAATQAAKDAGVLLEHYIPKAIAEHKLASGAPITTAEDINLLGPEPQLFHGTPEPAPAVPQEAPSVAPASAPEPPITAPTAPEVPTAPVETPPVEAPAEPPVDATATQPDAAFTPSVPVMPDLRKGESSILDRLTTALQGAGKATAEQARLYTEARKARIANVQQLQASTEGLSGFHAELGALGGEMPRANFEAVGDQFTPQEIDMLYNHIKDHPDVNAGNDPYASINARNGLTKILQGVIPGQSELDQLKKALPKEAIDAIEQKVPWLERAMKQVGNVANLPRALESTLDLSAPFRQGFFLSSRKEFYQAFPDMLKSMASEGGYQRLMEGIQGRETYPLMHDAGLYLANRTDDLTAREEQFATKYASMIPGVKGSERAFNGFLNKLRADVFDDIVQKSKAAGVDFDSNPKALTDIGKFINVATGRGELPKMLSQAGPLLNATFFSPRLMMSRMQLMNPLFYRNLSPVVRTEAIKSLLGTGALYTTVLGLAKAGGAEVEMDPRSSNYGKITVGNTHYDIGGGFNQYVTLAARLSSYIAGDSLKDTKTAKGELKDFGTKYGDPTALDAIVNFGESKASPIASFVQDYFRGKDAVGNRFDAKSAVVKRMIPLFLQDVYDVTKDEVKNKGDSGYVTGPLKALPSGLGIGVQNYDPYQIRSPSSFTVGGQQVSVGPISAQKYEDSSNKYFQDNMKIVQDLPKFKKMSPDNQRKIKLMLQREARNYARDQLLQPQPVQDEPQPEASPELTPDGQ